MASGFSPSQEVEHVAKFVCDEIAYFTDTVTADGVKGSSGTMSFAHSADTYLRA